MARSTALRQYHQKRNFTRTKEPRGQLKGRTGDLFVVQKHAARRLHYDLRLELDGVLKSWAVTKGPSLSPADKRLAVRVEDHPLDYADFEGRIPQGEYGAGSVIVWDRGRWSTEGDPHKQLAKGHLVVDLDGRKLKGRWHLVHMKGRDQRGKENWLLIKAEDEHATEQGGADLLDAEPESIKTGRTVEDVATSDVKIRRKPKVQTKPKRKRKSRRMSRAASGRRRGLRSRVQRLGRCRRSWNPSLLRSRKGRRPVAPGCTRSSSTGTGCWRASIAVMPSSRRAAGWTGQPNSHRSRKRSKLCRWSRHFSTARSSSKARRERRASPTCRPI